MIQADGRTYLLPPVGQFFKANLHTHTLVSDGRYTPQQVRDFYRKHGYQIVAFTDHDLCLSHNELCCDGFLPLTGYEMSIHSAIPCYEWHKICHLSFLSKKADMTAMVGYDRRFLMRGGNMYQYEDQVQICTEAKRVYSADYIQQAILEGKENGYLVILNHPVWSMQSQVEYEDLKGLWGVEVYNTGSVRFGLGDCTDLPLEHLLHRGEMPIPIAADDFHQESDGFGGWMMIGADALEYEAVIAAMERGDLYASTGPEIHSLWVQNGQLFITASACKRICLLTECRIGSCVSAQDEPLREACLDLRDWYNKAKERNAQNAYIRIRVEDGHGKCAYTRAYRMEELENAF